MVQVRFKEQSDKTDMQSKMTERVKEGGNVAGRRTDDRGALTGRFPDRLFI